MLLCEELRLWRVTRVGTRGGVVCVLKPVVSGVDEGQS